MGKMKCDIKQIRYVHPTHERLVASEEKIIH